MGCQRDGCAGNHGRWEPATRELARGTRAAMKRLAYRAFGRGRGRSLIPGPAR